MKRVSVEGAKDNYIYFKVKSDWIYCFTFKISNSVKSSVTFASICLLSKSFHPEKFNAQLKLMAEQYKNLDPTKVLEVYLAILTTGTFQSYKDSDYENSDQLDFGSFNNDLINEIQGDFVILWNSIILKKRILVFGNEVNEVIDFSRSLNIFSKHRKDAINYFRPLIRSDQESIDEIKPMNHFIAGSTDSALLAKQDIFDIIVNLESKKVIVSPGAIDDMRMNLIHRELHEVITNSCANNDIENLKIIELFNNKTSQLLGQLNSFAQDGKLTDTMISQRISNESAKIWLTKLAIIENLI